MIKTNKYYDSIVQLLGSGTKITANMGFEDIFCVAGVFIVENFAQDDVIIVAVIRRSFKYISI